MRTRENSVGQDPNVVFRAARIAGSAVLGGIAGYGVAKGLETYLPIQHPGMYETIAVIGNAILGALIASEITA